MTEPSLFSTVFAFLMIQLPLLFVALYRPARLATTATDRKRRACRLLTWLAIATGAADAIVVAAMIWYPAVVNVLWTLFFALWFGLAAPYLQTRYPALASPHPSNQPIRTASLTPRDAPIRTSAWNVVLACWSGVALLLLLACLGSEQEMGARTTPLVLTAVAAAVAVFSRWIGAMAVQQIRYEPSPLPSAASTRAEEAWADLRRFRARSFFYLSSLMPAPFAGAAAAVLWHAPIWLTVAIGAGGGCLIGIIGACLGIIAGTRQARLVHQADSGATADQHPAAGH